MSNGELPGVAASSRQRLQKTALDRLSIWFLPFDCQEHAWSIVPDHLGRLHEEIKAGGRQTRRKRLHADEDLCDEVRQSLNHCRFPVMAVRWRDENAQSKRMPKGGRNFMCRPVSSDWASSDFQASDAILGALRPNRRWVPNMSTNSGSSVTIRPNSRRVFPTPREPRPKVPKVIVLTGNS